MSHLTNEITAQVSATGNSPLSNIGLTSAASSISQDVSAIRVAPVQAGTKDFGRVRIGGCCIRY